MWLIVLNKLPTTDRLLQIGISATNTCPICNNSQESVEHLFFDCPYSKETWKLVMTEFPAIQSAPWSEILEKLLNPAGILAACDAVFKRRLSALAYYIWLERNYRKFENSSLAPTSLANLINAALL